MPRSGQTGGRFSDQVFPTPSGKIELLSEEAAQRWGVDPLPHLRQRPSIRGGGDGGASDRPQLPLVLLTPNTKNRIHSQFGNLRMIRSRDRTADRNPPSPGRRGASDRTTATG